MNVFSSHASHQVHFGERNRRARPRVFLLLDEFEWLFLFFWCVSSELLLILILSFLWHVFRIRENSIVEMVSTRFEIGIMLLNVVFDVFVLLFRHVYNLELIFVRGKELFHRRWWLERVLGPLWDVILQLFLV